MADYSTDPGALYSGAPAADNSILLSGGTPPSAQQLVLTPVDHDPFASGGSASAQAGGSMASSGAPSLDPAASHNTLSAADRNAAGPYSHGLLGIEAGSGEAPKSGGATGEPAGAPSDEIMPASEWGDFVSNLKNGEIPFKDLPDKYKEALKGKENDYELMRMGIAKPLSDLTNKLFNPSAGSGGKEGGRVSETPAGGPSSDPALGALGASSTQGFGEGDVPAGGQPAGAGKDKSFQVLNNASALPKGSGYATPQAQQALALMVQGLPDGKGGWKVPPLPPYVATALVAAGMGESGINLDPAIGGDKVKTKNGWVPTSFGGWQWHGDRWTAMQQWAKDQGISDPRTAQALYASYELQHMPGAMAQVARVKDAASALPLLVVGNDSYERAAAATAHLPQRQAYLAALQHVGTTSVDHPELGKTDVPVLQYDPKNGIMAQGDQVKAYQAMLAGLGYYHGQIDGQFGPQTKAATQNFQSHYPSLTGARLKSDGKIGLGPSGQTGPALMMAYNNKYGFSEKNPGAMDHLGPAPAYAPVEEVTAGGPDTSEAAVTRAHSIGPYITGRQTGNRTGIPVRDVSEAGAAGEPIDIRPPAQQTRDSTNAGAKADALPANLQGISGPAISNALGAPTPDSNTLFGASVAPGLRPDLASFNASDKAMAGTQPPPGFASTFPARPQLIASNTGAREAGASDPTSVIDNTLGATVKAVSDLPAIRRGLAEAGVLDPTATWSGPTGEMGWPGAGQPLAKPPSNYDVLSGSDKKGLSDFDSWYQHVQQSLPEAYGAIQRLAKTKGISNEDAAKEVFKKIPQDVKNRTSDAGSKTRVARNDSPDPYGQGTDKYGLPYEAQEPKIFLDSIQSGQTHNDRFYTKQEFLDEGLGTEKDWENELNRQRGLDNSFPPNSSDSPTSMRQRKGPIGVALT